VSVDTEAQIAEAESTADAIAKHRADLRERHQALTPAEQDERDREDADRFGIELRFVKTGRDLGVDPEELAALDGCRTQAEVVEALDDLERRKRARAET
jgi:hypothetical protein